MHVYTYVYICILKYTCVHAYMYICMHIHMSVSPFFRSIMLLDSLPLTHILTLYPKLASQLLT